MDMGLGELQELLKLRLEYFGHLMQRDDLLEKTLMLGKIEGRRRRVWQRMRWLNWHHWINGHEFEKATGDGDGEGSLACCSPWGHKESDTEWTEWSGGFPYVLQFKSEFCNLNLAFSHSNYKRNALKMWNPRKLDQYLKLLNLCFSLDLDFFCL